MHVRSETICIDVSPWDCVRLTTQNQLCPVLELHQMVLKAVCFLQRGKVFERLLERRWIIEN